MKDKSRVIGTYWKVYGEIGINTPKFFFHYKKKKYDYFGTNKIAQNKNKKLQTEWNAITVQLYNNT